MTTSEPTVAELRAEHAQAVKAHAERVDSLAQAFTKLQMDDGEDMADAIRAANLNRGHGIELSVNELERISLRITELNSMAMQGGLVQTSAEYEGKVRAAEEAARGTQTGRISVSRPNFSQSPQELTERQKRNREAGPNVDSPL